MLAGRLIDMSKSARGRLEAADSAFLEAQKALSVPFARVSIHNTTTQAGRTVTDVVVPLAKGRLKVAPVGKLTRVLVGQGSGLPSLRRSRRLEGPAAG